MPSVNAYHSVTIRLALGYHSHRHGRGGPYLFVHCQLSTVNCQLSIVNCHLFCSRRCSAELQVIFFVYCPEYYSGNCPLLIVSCQLSIVNCPLSSALVVLCERTCCWIKFLSLLRNLPNGFAVPSIPSATTPPLRLRCYSPLSTVLCPTLNCQLSIVN